jgi:hypothetical protein
MDFSDNFHNIKKFIQVDHFEKKLKNLFIFLYCSQKTANDRKKVSSSQN